MLERRSSGGSHLRTLCRVCDHRLVFWYTASFLRLEYANESTDEALSGIDIISWFLVSPTSPPHASALPLTPRNSASTATIVRIVYVKSLAATDDYSWEGINLAKWSMIEPAIAITAMNIATLRPMFKNVLRFASKSFDSNDEEAKRPSGESRTALRSRNSVSAKDYSVEFAELLGLSRVGVTTHISAGGSQPEKDQLRKRFALRRSITKVSLRNESQTELNAVSPSTDDGIDWIGGIKATTVVTHDIS